MSAGARRSAKDMVATDQAADSGHLAAAAKRAASVPNFFIIGAPKCGTTSLFSWLADHPNIFMPRWKEPHYFNDDHHTRGIDCERDYLRLFHGREPEQQAVGEASVWYLYSKNAVKNILTYNSAARFIVCLRNPIDMALSLHNQLLFSGYETIRDFEEAWDAQADRDRGRRIPLLCREPPFLQYGAVCSLGHQLRRLYETAPHDAVLTVVFDDIVRDAKSEYRRVLGFLGLSGDGRDMFPAANTAMQRRSYALLKAVQIGKGVKGKLGIRAGSAVLDKIDRTNRKARQRQNISARLREKLSEYFATDVTQLSELLSRDLSCWLKHS